MDSAADNRWLGWLAGLAPTLAIFVGWMIGASQGHLPVCIPNLDGCLPTSATGRVPPEAFVFKPLMMMAAVAICILWTRVSVMIARRWLFILSVAGAIGLVVYAIALGATGEAMRAVRRLGVAVFFVTTLACQVTLVADLWRRYTGSQPRLRLALSVLLVLQVLLGVGSFFIADSVADRHAFQNAVEWNYLPLTCLFFVLLGHLKAGTAAGS